MEQERPTITFDPPAESIAEINELLRRYGVKFGIYKNGQFKEQLFPFDPIPRIITRSEFIDIEKGLIQRVDALNALENLSYLTILFSFQKHSSRTLLFVIYRTVPEIVRKKAAACATASFDCV